MPEELDLRIFYAVFLPSIRRGQWWVHHRSCTEKGTSEYWRALFLHELVEEDSVGSRGYFWSRPFHVRLLGKGIDLVIANHAEYREELERALIANTERVLAWKKEI